LVTDAEFTILVYMRRAALRYITQKVDSPLWGRAQNIIHISYVVACKFPDNSLLIFDYMQR